MTCELCKGTGIFNGRECKCVIEKLIKASLPPALNTIKIPNEIKRLLIDDPIYDINLYFGGNLLFSTDGKQKINYKQFVKLYAIHLIIKHKIVKIYYLTGKELFDVYMSDDLSIQKDILNADLVILSFGNDYKNSYLQDLMPFLLSTRTSNNKQTFILWENPLIKNSIDKKEYIIDKYSELTYNYILTSFLVADKKLTFDDKRFFLKE